MSAGGCPDFSDHGGTQRGEFDEPGAWSLRRAECGHGDVQPGSGYVVAIAANEFGFGAARGDSVPKRTSIARLQAEYDRYCRRIDSSPKLHRFAVVDRDFAEPYVEVRADGYHLIARERGHECLHRVTTRMDTLLYWLIEDVTSSLASDFELKHRVSGPDCRRIWFAKSLELMTTVNSKWGGLLREELDAILADYPYEDDEVADSTVVTPVRGLAKIG